MIRAIIKRTLINESGTPIICHYTVDFKAPELETALRRGGHGVMHGVFGADIHTLEAVEILDDQPKERGE